MHVVPEEDETVKQPHSYGVQYHGSINVDSVMVCLML